MIVQLLFFFNHGVLVKIKVQNIRYVVVHTHSTTIGYTINVIGLQPESQIASHTSTAQMFFIKFFIQVFSIYCSQ